MSLEKLVAINISVASNFSDKVYPGSGDEQHRVLGLK